MLFLVLSFVIMFLFIERIMSDFSTSFLLYFRKGYLTFRLFCKIKNFQYAGLSKSKECLLKVKVNDVLSWGCISDTDSRI